MLPGGRCCTKLECPQLSLNVHSIPKMAGPEDSFRILGDTVQNHFCCLSDIHLFPVFFLLSGLNGFNIQADVKYVWVCSTLRFDDLDSILSHRL